MVAGFWAVVSAASTPNQSLLHVLRVGKSWRHDAWQWWRRNWGNRASGRGFLHDAISLINQLWWSPSSYDRRGAPLPAFKHTIISQHTMQQVSIVKTSKNYHYSCLLASLRHDASCLIVPGCNGPAAYAEHQRRRWLHICCTYMFLRMAGMLGLPCRSCSGMLRSGCKWSLLRLCTHHVQRVPVALQC